MWPFDRFKKNKEKEGVPASEIQDKLLMESANSRTAAASEASEAPSLKEKGDKGTPGHIVEIDPEAIIEQVEHKSSDQSHRVDKDDPANFKRHESAEAEKADEANVPAAEADTGREDPAAVDRQEQTAAKVQEEQGVITDATAGSDKQDKMTSDARTEKKKEEVEEKPRSLYDWTRQKKRSGKADKKKKTEKIPVAVGNTVLGDGIPKICVPIVGRTKEEILLQASEIVRKSPSIVEWRADFFENLLTPLLVEDLIDSVQGVSVETEEVVNALAEILGEIPILFTFRTKREGGEREISPAQYITLNQWAASKPEISMIDVEATNPDLDAEALIYHLRRAGSCVIASSHNFKRTPKKAELYATFETLEKSGADILKVAVMPQKSRDVLRLLSVTAEVNEEISTPIVTMAMGDLGRISRVSGELTGSAMTFAAIGDASAPGQMEIDDLRQVMNHLHSVSD